MSIEGYDDWLQRGLEDELPAEPEHEPPDESCWDYMEGE